MPCALDSVRLLSEQSKESPWQLYRVAPVSSIMGPLISRPQDQNGRYPIAGSAALSTPGFRTAAALAPIACAELPRGRAFPGGLGGARVVPAAPQRDPADGVAVRPRP